MDAQRALLDELMGRNRDGDKPNEEITDFRDKRVCKKFLCGLCPHDLFQNTKMDMGECMKLHLPKLRTNYEKERTIRDFGYEIELERDLHKYISDVERKIQRAQKRLEEQEGSKAPSLGDVENCTEVLELTAEIQEIMQQAEEAGNEGEVDLSMELMQKVEELKQKKADAQANAMLRSLRPVNPEENHGSENKPTDNTPLVSINPQHAGANVNQKLRVCDVCGAFLSIFDSDRRLADHFGGKLHLGYMQIRKKLEEIAASRKNSSTNNSGTPREERKTSGAAGGDNERPDSRKSRRSRSNSRSRSRRDSHRSKGSHRRRDRSRDRDRDSDRDRSSRRHRRRSRSYSRSKSRSRSRSRRH